PQVVQKTQPQQSQIRTQASNRRYQQQTSPHVQDGYYSPTMTPDMHAGRRFINLAEEAGRGEIVLPIRGERVLKSFRNEQFDQNEAEKESQKVQQLDNLINQIRSKEVIQKQIIESQKIKEIDEAKKRRLEDETRKAKQQEVINISEENRRAQERVKLEAERQKAEEERRLAEEKAREQAVKEQERLQGLRDQENLLKQQREELLKKQVQVQTKPEPRAIPLKPAQIEESPNTPNIIWGMVVTIYQGNKVPVPAVVVVVRNQRKEVVRAVKTSGQGKFGITTPLINGLYTIEVDKEKKSGLIFDITAIEAKGEPIPTIEMVGKV
ncbi:MAG: hypothetical protein WC988_02930, partial [Patescibacteria group bacterium]